ncbi:NACHT-domain-containing protein [Aulographum hederae CBS 113979]|uniref:NACHT-domain-containing protein n=1 Tax=Aulographum hederae CBS 113979 TaxID=1176131 RepID=A0A6G1HBY6_9PEZI|nr:NACHT-domain-containing protein [Aulographum hederae CBS 113979]
MTNNEKQCLMALMARQYGLHQVWPPFQADEQDSESPSASVDVVAIHGLDTGSPRTWIAYAVEKDIRSRAVHWLEDDDMLPSVIPNARIFTYDWNANTFKGAAEDNLPGHATAFLDKLKQKRHLNAQGRPIIFVASCFGGLLLGEALIQASAKQSEYIELIKSIIGIAFLGTPFRGSGANKAAVVRVRVAKFMHSDYCKLLIKHLDPKNGRYDHLVTNLSALVSKFHIPTRCFYEILPTNYLREVSNKWFADIVNRSPRVLVDMQSACLGGPLPQQLNVSHAMLNKFRGPNDENFKTVSFQLKIFADNYLESRLLQDKENEECLRHLRSTDPRDDKKRIEQTKGGLLHDAYCWILQIDEFKQWRDNQQNPLLWIKGDPGKGKTMLLCGIINELSKSIGKNGLLSYFFCQGADSRINNAVAVLRGLIYLLITQQPPLISHVRKKYDQAGQALFDGVNAWVSLFDIFTDILQDLRLKPTYFIIDALDECVTDLQQLLDLIVQRSSHSPKVKWIVSSRNWPNIEEELGTARQKLRLSLEISAELVTAAVAEYIQHKVHQLTVKKHYSNETEEAVQQYLSLHANGTFLWVALACQSLEKVPKWTTLRTLMAIPPGLDNLYATMIGQVYASKVVDPCKQILAVVSIARRPLALKELAVLVDRPEGNSDDLESLNEIVGFCGSFLTVRESTVYFVHQSAKDFLLKNQSQTIFPSGSQEVDRTIFSKSLELMSRTLERDMYHLYTPEIDGLRAFGVAIDEIKQPDQNPLAAAGYPCVYWVDHFCAYAFGENVKQGGDLQDSGTTLASASYDGTVKLWDAGSSALQQTLDVDSRVDTLFFSDDGIHVQTNMGSLPILSCPPARLAVSHQVVSPFIFVKDQWVCSQSVSILWLPPDHRPHCIAVYGGTVGFGYVSGRVTIIELSL